MTWRNPNEARPFHHSDRFVSTLTGDYHRAEQRIEADASMLWDHTGHGCRRWDEAYMAALDRERLVDDFRD